MRVLWRGAQWGLVVFFVHAVVICIAVLLDTYAAPPVASLANETISIVEYPVSDFAQSHRTQEYFFPVADFFAYGLGFDHQATVAAVVIVMYSIFGGSYYFSITTIIASLVVYNKAKHSQRQGGDAQ